MSFSLGLDFGTSALKAIGIDATGHILYHQQVPLPDPASPTRWQAALWQVLSHIPPEIISRIQHIAIAGTSGTVLLTDGAGEPVAPVLMYDDNRGGIWVKNCKNWYRPTIWFSVQRQA